MSVEDGRVGGGVYGREGMMVGGRRGASINLTFDLKSVSMVSRFDVDFGSNR